MPYNTFTDIISGIITYPLLASISYSGQVCSGVCPYGSLSGSSVYIYLDMESYNASGVENKFHIPNYSFQFIDAENLSLGIVGNPHRYAYNFAVHCYAKDRAGAMDLASGLEAVIIDTWNYSRITAEHLIYERDYVKLVCLVRGLAHDD